MTPTIWDSLANTPWWIFIAYPYFLYLSYQATKPRFIAYSAFRNTAIIFTIAATLFLIFTKSFKPSQAGMWSAALIAGIAIGWIQFQILRIKARKNDLSLRTPGNWLLVLLVIGTMYYQYQHGYNSVFSLSNLNNSRLIAWLPIIYGLLSGAFIGKAIYAKRCIMNGPYLA